MKILFKQLFSMALMLIVFTASAFAASPKDVEINAADIAIGGITFGISEDYVKQVYGLPKDIEYDSNAVWGKMHTYNYGDSFFVTFGDHGVLSVKTTANNGLKTPPGFTVGMPISSVENYYGPNKGFAKKKGQYCSYNAEWYKNISFKADSDGKISSIQIYMTP